jgi:hypothetical protein
MLIQLPTILLLVCQPDVEKAPIRVESTLDVASSITAIAASSDDRLLAVAVWAKDRTSMLKIIDQKSLKVTELPARNAEITGIGFSTDHRYAITTHYGGTIIRWDLSDGVEIARVRFRDSFANVNLIGDSHFFTTFQLQMNWAIDWRQRRVCAIDPAVGDGGGLQAIAKSSPRLVVGYGDLTPARRGEVNIWNYETGKLLKLLKTGNDVTGIAINATGDAIAIGNNKGHVTVWTSDGTKVSDARVLADDVHNIVFDPSGRLIIATDLTGNIQVVDVNTKAAVALIGHRSALVKPLFVENGRKLITADSNGKILIWRIDRPVRKLVPKENPDL